MKYCQHCRNIYQIVNELKQNIVNLHGGADQVIDSLSSQTDSDNNSNHLIDTTTKSSLRPPVTNIIDIIKNKDFDSISNIDVTKINLQNLQQTPIYKKLSGSKKDYIFNYINDKQTTYKQNKPPGEGPKHTAYFFCNTCGFYEPVKPKTKIFSILSDETRTYTNIHNDYGELINMNTIFRTKVYTCINKSCPTQNDSSIKEAVFTRQVNTAKIIYACTVCESHWT